MPESTSLSIAAILKYGWLALIGMGAWVWKNLASQVNKNTEALNEHIIEDLKAHEDFITHGYMQDEIKPWLNRIDKKMDKLVTQTADVIKRDEYKSDITALHIKIDAVKDMVR